MKRIGYLLLLVFVLLLRTACSAAETEVKDKKFDVTEYIFYYINDLHEWHFLSVGETEVAIPLPIILYSEHTGWHFFSSHQLYKHKQDEAFPFSIRKEGVKREQIIEKLPDGTEFIPLDLSITKTVLGVIIVALILLLFFILGARRTIKNPMEVPKKTQNIIEPMVTFVQDIARDFAGEKYKHYMPYFLTVFSFVLVANIVGLILPLELGITSNISVTFVLAAFTFIITTLSGNKHYWMHIINPPGPIYMKLPIPLSPFIEFLGIFIKPIVLMIRLFANMLAGHMIVTVLVGLIFLMSSIFHPLVGAGTSIISLVFSVFMVVVDILVAFIQAYIFTLLSAMYIGMATEKGH